MVLHFTGYDGVSPISRWVYRGGKRNSAVHHVHGPEMEINESVYNGWGVIAMKGKFVVRNLTRIRKVFERAEGEELPKVALDMSGVLEVDSSAITILVNFQRRIIQKDGLLVLFGLQPGITEIFSIVGIDKLFRICTTRENFEALYVQE